MDSKLFFVSFNQGEKLGDGVFLGDVFEHTLFATIEANFAAACAYIALIGICHLARTIHNTTHDTNFQSLQVRCGCFYLGYGLLQIE